jgi:hypothetical protein
MELGLININVKNSAVAFFFLFFLHGFSIVNGQQCISYNGSRLGEVGGLKAQSLKLLLILIKTTNDE